MPQCSQMVSTQSLYDRAPDPTDSRQVDIESYLLGTRDEKENPDPWKPACGMMWLDEAEEHFTRGPFTISVCGRQHDNRRSRGLGKRVALADAVRRCSNLSYLSNSWSQRSPIWAPFLQLAIKGSMYVGFTNLLNCIEIRPEGIWRIPV